MHTTHLLMLQLLQHLPFIKDRVDGAFGQHTSLAHLFHGEHLLILLAFDFPHLAETALAYRIVVLKGCLGQRRVQFYLNYYEAGFFALPVRCSVSRVAVAAWKLQLPILFLKNL